MSRVLISGYYGFGNAGDEAVLAALLASLRREAPEAQCEVLSIDPAATTRLHGVAASHRGRPREVVPAMRRCDLFVSGGGSLLQDVTSLSSLLFYLAQIALARALRRPVMIYAQGIGPLRRPAARRLTAAVLRRAAAITVRDAESATELRRLGLIGARPPIEVTADPVFSLRPAAAEWARADLRACLEGRDEGGSWRLRSGEAPSVRGAAGREGALGISLRQWPGLEEQVEALTELIRGTAAETGLQPVYFPLQESEDAAVCRRVAERTGGCILRGGYSPAEWMALAGATELFLGMRLHALIFAAAMSVPLVGLSYDPKIDALLARLGGAPAASLKAFDAAAVRQALRDTWNVRERRRVQLQEAVSELAAAAEVSARHAAGLLGRGGAREARASQRSRGQTPAGH